ncbi:unnamed protein product [Calypogeia fissa]
MKTKLVTIYSRPEVHESKESRKRTEERVPLLNYEARQDGEEEEEKLRQSEEEGKPEDGPDQSPVEQVALTVPTTDDPTLPVWTFRVWTLGLASCVVISVVNMFFDYRTEPLTLTSVSAQIASLPLGHLMAATLPRSVRVPFLRAGRGLEIVLNPGPFNAKEHVLIAIFGSAGAGFGSGEVYAINTVNTIKPLPSQHQLLLSLHPSRLITRTWIWMGRDAVAEVCSRSSSNVVAFSIDAGLVVQDSS